MKQKRVWTTQGLLEHVAGLLNVESEPLPPALWGVCVLGGVTAAMVAEVVDGSQTHVPGPVRSGPAPSFLLNAHGSLVAVTAVLRGRAVKRVPLLG